ncbi:MULTISPECIES: MAB_1171c family putative transporter [unclassified Streptomyces]|uniref:MAB_1171c family putative transporter n=1 Tax=unclassified Streptomyces TaxID=2593676 RepID=UPI0033B39780
MDASPYYIPALALWAGLGAKLPDLRRTWRDPLVRSVCWVIFLGGAGFLFAAPPTVAAVNHASGVPNLAAPLDYAIVSAYSASCLLLILRWRGGPPDRVRRLVRCWQIGYTVLITLLVVLFLMGNAPVERRTDLDTYYATTPWTGQMIALYLIGHMTAAVATTTLCWHWALQVRGWLRAGLWLLVAAWLLNLSFSTLKLIAVAARWNGYDWDVLSTVVAPGLVGLAATVATAGFTVPFLGPRSAGIWHAAVTWWRLGPLWHELGAACPRGPLATPIPWYSSYSMRLTRREAGIQDGLNLVRPHLDDRVRSLARAAARAAGHGDEDAASIGLAAMIAAAVHTRSDSAPTHADVYDHAAGLSARATLVGVARALRTSGIVATARAEAAVDEGIRT